MTGRLSSPRFRRRLYWAVGSVTVLAGATVGAILVGNTGRSNETPLIDKPAWVYREPARMRLTKSDRQDLFNTASLFIRTAVARKHLDSAWNMLGPEMKAGQTRKSWDTGNNNVIPFPAIGIANWSILYAYRNDVAIDLGVIGDPHSDWAGKTFTIELKHYKSQPHSWLVASWVPKGIGGAGQVKSVASAPAPPPTVAAVDAKWLLAPLAVLGLIILSLVGWGVRSTVKHRRAAKRYAELLGYNSSSNPS
jgi:hypothetical protein